MRWNVEVVESYKGYICSILQLARLTFCFLFLFCFLFWVFIIWNAFPAQYWIAPPSLPSPLSPSYKINTFHFGFSEYEAKFYPKKFLPNVQGTYPVTPRNVFRTSGYNFNSF